MTAFLHVPRKIGQIRQISDICLLEKNLKKTPIETETEAGQNVQKCCSYGVEQLLGTKGRISREIKGMTRVA